MAGSKLPSEWKDDGHRIGVTLNYDTVHLHIICPGEGCQANKLGCGDCEGTAAEGCRNCGGTGVEPSVPEGFCWLRDMAPEWDFIETFNVGLRQELPADTRIVWKVNYDEWEWMLRDEAILLGEHDA